MSSSAFDAGAALPPVVEFAYSAARSRPVPPARSVARSIPLEEDRRRVLLAVAEGMGDPSSAEAQAAEALGRLEALVTRSSSSAPAARLLDLGVEAAADGVARLARLPGSVPGSGAALTAALIEDGTLSIASIGRGAVYLLRENRLRRLSGAAQPNDPAGGPQLLGGEGHMSPLLATAELVPGDTVLLCSAGVVRGLGPQVIQAVVEEYGTVAAAQELAELASEQGEAGSGAVALYHLPGDPALEAAPVPVALPEAPVRRNLAPWAAIFAAAVAMGALLAAGGLYLHNRGTGGNTAAVVTPARALGSATPLRAALPATPRATPPAATARAATPPPTTPGVLPLVSPQPASTPLRTPTVSPSPAAGTPATAATLPACTAAGPRPCLYTAVAGDFAGRITGQFNVTLACFESANSLHTPAPPSAANGERIGLAEQYVIPDPASCAPAAVATPTAGATAPAANTAAAATPTPVCTPRPGATAPNPLC